MFVYSLKTRQVKSSSTLVLKQTLRITKCSLVDNPFLNVQQKPSLWSRCENNNDLTGEDWQKFRKKSFDILATLC